MPYASGRVIHDADAHIMEMPGFLAGHLEAKYRERVTDTVLFPRRDGFQSRIADAEGAKGEAFDDSQIMLAKNWSALGSWRKQDRTRSVDLLGFASQLIHIVLWPPIPQIVAHPVRWRRRLLISGQTVARRWLF